MRVYSRIGIIKQDYPSRHSHSSSITTHTALFSATQPACSSHTPFLSSPTSAHYSKSILPYSLRPNRRRSPHIHLPLTLHTALFSCPNRRRSPHIHLSLTIHTTLFSATQPASISSHIPFLSSPTSLDYSISVWACECVRLRVCARFGACVRVCVCACVHVRVRECMCVWVYPGLLFVNHIVVSSRDTTLQISTHFDA